MKKILVVMLFCILSFCACEKFGNSEKKVSKVNIDEQNIEEQYKRTNKDEAKELALQAKEEYEEKHNFEKAIELFEKAIEIDSEEEWIYADMARTKMEIRDYKGAIEDLKKAMELKEKNDLNNIEEEKQQSK